MRNLNFFQASTCMAIQEPNGNTWIWPTKAPKTIQRITANLIGTATIATTPLKSFAQWYGLKSKESLRLWPLTVHCRDVRSRVINELFERPSVKNRVRCFQKNMPHLHLDSKPAVRKFITITSLIPYCTWHPALQNKNPLAEWTRRCAKKMYAKKGREYATSSCQ